MQPQPPDALLPLTWRGWVFLNGAGGGGSLPVRLVKSDKLDQPGQVGSARRERDGRKVMDSRGREKGGWAVPINRAL